MNKKALELTIVIPAFNEQDHIKACLSAIAAQTVMPDEVLLVDNNSQDKTVEIAKQYSFVKVIKEKKQGVRFARDRGFNSAGGQIIARIDADTILPLRWISQVKEQMADPAIAAITGPVNYYDMPFPESNHHPDHLMRASIYNWSPKSPFLFGSNMALRAEVWTKLRSSLCTDEYMHEDLDLAIHLYMTKQKYSTQKTYWLGLQGVATMIRQAVFINIYQCTDKLI